MKLFVRLSITIFICCGFIVWGAITAGRRSREFSFGYQEEGHSCTTQWVDLQRSSATVTLNNRQPFCILHSAWSPNRRYAAVQNYRVGTLSIATGRNRDEWQPLFNLDGVMAFRGVTRWSEDSQYLSFFLDEQDKTVIGILQMENDIPRKPRFFTIKDISPVYYSPPSWSPDGQFLAFAAYTIREQGAEELYLLDVNTGDVRRLTDNHFRDDSPSWSPDGTQLVFTSAEDGYNELHIIDVVTGERHQLTRFTIGYLPSWSPDGKSIMFMSNIDHNNDLYIIKADGTGLRRLTYNHYTDSVFPIWLFPS